MEKWKSTSESTLTYIIYTSATDGVILVDPEYLKDRKGELESIFVIWHECIEMAILDNTDKSVVIFMLWLVTSNLQILNMHITLSK